MEDSEHLFSVSTPEPETPMNDVKDVVFNSVCENVYPDCSGESSTLDRYLMFNSPVTPKGNVISVFDSCCRGSCECSYLLAGVPVQIKPCRLAAAIFGTECVVYDDLWKLFVGVADGFDVVDNTDIPEYDCKNYRSILVPEYKQKMDSIIKSEIANGMISEVEVKPHCIHALGAVPKPDGGMRPITDCSLPEDICINRNMDSLVHSFRFKNVDSVVENLERGDFLAVVDIKNAYRSVPINPDHSKYQGIRWQLDSEPEKFYIDRRLCFGLRCGPYYFNLLSEFIAYYMSIVHNVFVVNYLDDFLVKGSTFEECCKNQHLVIEFLRFLGLHISWHKVSPPAQVTVYLGITIDSVKMELRLPEGKLDKLNDLLKEFEDKKSASKHQLEKLAGSLAHCATVVRGGRTFCRRIYDACKVASRNKSKHVRLNVLIREDIKWWKRFAAVFNGRAAIQNQWYAIPMVSDSSGRGFAVYLGQDWVAGTWNNSFVNSTECNHIVPSPELDCYDSSNINVLELWPIVKGVQRWCRSMRNTKVECKTDNMQVFYMLKTGRSANASCMFWLRELFWICVIYNISLSPTYIPTAENVQADLVSRLAYPEYARSGLVELPKYEICCIESLLNICRDVVGASEEESEEIQA